MLFQPALLRDVHLDLSSISELPDLPPLWALHDLFPCHRLSLVAAPTGSGLTQLACHLASAIASQPGIPSGQMIYPAANPDGTLPDPILAPGQDSHSLPSVLLISHRDGPDVLKPRLQALGIDPDQVLILSQVHRELPKVINQPPRTRSAPFSLDDLDALSELLHEHRTIRLVLIDNADLLFAATNDPARAKVQRDLDSLAIVAQEGEVAIVLLAGIPQLQRNPFASRLFAAMRDACRLVYFMAPDLEDSEHRLLFCIKNTLTRTNSTRKLSPLCTASPGSFRALTTQLQSLTLPHYFTLLHRQQCPSGPSPDRHDDACQFLLQALSAGPRPAGARKNPAPGTLRHMADEAGCAWATVLRAKETLQITSHFKTDHWTWHLPTTIPQLPNASLPSPAGRGVGGEGAVLGTPPSIDNKPDPSPSSSSTKYQVPSTPTSTCAPPPLNPAQPPVPPQDTPPHPTPAPTCAPASTPDTCDFAHPAPANNSSVAQSSPTAVPAPVPGAGLDGQPNTPATTSSPTDPSIAQAATQSPHPPLPPITHRSSLITHPSSPELGAPALAPDNTLAIPA